RPPRTVVSPLSLHDALPISAHHEEGLAEDRAVRAAPERLRHAHPRPEGRLEQRELLRAAEADGDARRAVRAHHEALASGQRPAQTGRAHVWTPVTGTPRMRS